ncbi:MAG: nitrite/sulfite reductase [Pseudomonadota bacterium]
MYIYDSHDQAFVEDRAKEFRDQVQRRLSGELSEDEFKPLRLMNGLYLQLHAYMLRVAIPYGLLSSEQMRTLAYLAEHYDRGYGHFTTRQNIQYNWTQLSDVPDMLDKLAEVQMHAIQTSGNCIRNITCDPFAGVAGDEWIDPRPTAELLRQWSSLHPEFAFLPRKFKFAVTGAVEDRAAIKFHDIGIVVRAADDGSPLYQIWVGGGQGRTPRVARLFADDVKFTELLPLLDSMMRVYNLHGRRDNKYKARIKILIDELGIENYRDEVLADLEDRDTSQFDVAKAEYDRIAVQFEEAILAPIAGGPVLTDDPAFKNWLDNNVSTHKVDGFAIVSVSLKPKGGIPGDATAEQMYAISAIADDFSNGELRITHRQNLVLPWVKSDELRSVYDALIQAGLAESNIGLASDIIACPGLDYCALATARSIPIAQELSDRLSQREAEGKADGITLNISGCINACGHHHAANIGILGLNRKETENYQITLGGRSDGKAQVGEVLGPGFSAHDLPDAIERIIDAYHAKKQDGESFHDVYTRIGKAEFKEAVYVDS